MVLDENLPDVPHLQDADRVAIARVAVEELGTELLVLDDGFQHRRLARDLDLVLLDALDPFGQGSLLPRGLLREPVTSLQRAGVVVLTRSDLVDAPSRLAIRERAERRVGALRWVATRHGPRDVVGHGVEPGPANSLSARAVAAFCGIGNPDGFFRTIEPLCGSVMGFRLFPDHHPYTAADVADLAAWARSLGADLALTTQKDLVKLRVTNLGGVPLRALRVGLEVLEGGELLEAALADLMPPGGSS
jgi:tetraacyldisaccharide 4'-kinase